ncbi:TPA: MarR family transcriptional regulator [Candidatus Micrarchaeota archaeon]|nr:MarR family transcriptional regulator [Candidatus Micrarchaeota archaeon]
MDRWQQGRDGAYGDVRPAEAPPLGLLHPAGQRDISQRRRHSPAPLPEAGKVPQGRLRQQVYLGVEPVTTIKERVLEYLRTRRKARVSEIAEELGAKVRSVRYVIKGLEDKGLVRRVYDGSLDYDVVWLGD